MTITEVSRIISENNHIRYTDTKKVLNDFIEIINKELKEGNSVYLKNFGRFVVIKRNKRTGRNIATGEKIEIPEKKIVAFKASKSLREMLSSS